MYPITLQEIVTLTQATAGPGLDLDAICDGAIIDSRDARSGDLFFALQGSRSHGLQFASSALNDGAEAVVCEQSRAFDLPDAHLLVPDVEIALAELAYHNRKRSEALIIGVTGTVGKTTTRRMLTSVLESGFTGIQSPNNFNNHLGVPLSLLELQEGDEFGVIEIATSMRGDIQALSTIASPEMAVVTRVTPVHLTGFSSLREVQKEKQKLVEALDTDGTAFLNADDPMVMEMAQVCRGRVITFGFADSADIQITNCHHSEQSLHMSVAGKDYAVPVRSRQLACNAAAAIAVGLELGLSQEQIADGLVSFQNLSGRQQLHNIGPWSVIDDSYNSSPASVAAAIDCVQNFEGARHRIMVLNDMLDLGEQSQDLHFGIGATLANSSVDHVVVLGEFAADVVEGFQSAGGHVNRCSAFNSIEQMLPVLDCLLSDHDVVLLKGSRATEMERLLNRLEDISSGDGVHALRPAA